MNLALITAGIVPIPSARKPTVGSQPPKRPTGPRPNWMRQNAVTFLVWQRLDDFEGEYYTSRELSEALGIPNARVAPVLTYMHNRGCTDRIPLDNGSYAYARAAEWSKPAC